MLHTIIQIIAFQALFLLVYDLLLKRETFFNCNRAYLLVTSIVSIILPFLSFSELQKITSNTITIQLPEVFIGANTPSDYELLIAEQAGIILEQPKLSFLQNILLFGISISALIFLYKISKLYLLRYRNPKRWHGDVLIVNLIKSSVAFSFFNTIFLGDRIPDTEKPTIYKHELVHVKELHTLDLLYFEFMRIIFWFNPMAYIYHSRIKELHEYIADAKSVKQNGKTEYYQSLLNQVFDTNKISFTNTFFKKSLIKKRITMLQKSRSKQANLIKYALLVPLIFGMLFYISCEKEPFQDNDSLDLNQFSYSLSKGESLTGEKKEIHNRYEEFLKSNKDYVSWAEINFDTEEIRYSVHHKNELVPEGYIPLEYSSSDGRSYTSYMNLKNNKNMKTVLEVDETNYSDYDESKEVPFKIIDEVPVIQDCENLLTNEERKNCVNRFINKHVNRNFDTSLAKNLGLSNGRKRIFVQFKIDTNGEIFDIKSRAPHPKLEEEAKRVIKLLPQFIPGKHNGEKVDVPYTLPIVFQVTGS